MRAQRAARATRGDRHAGLDTINTTFLNRQLAPEPEAGPFGVCFVAFSGTRNRRYRGERLLEVAATQMRAASPSTKLCVVTDQPHKSRRFVDLVLLTTAFFGAGRFFSLLLLALQGVLQIPLMATQSHR